MRGENTLAEDDEDRAAEPEQVPQESPAEAAALATAKRLVSAAERFGRAAGTAASAEGPADHGGQDEAAARTAQDAAPTAYTEWGGGASNPRYCRCGTRNNTTVATMIASTKTIKR